MKMEMMVVMVVFETSTIELVTTALKLNPVLETVKSYQRTMIIMLFILNFGGSDENHDGDAGGKARTMILLEGSGPREWVGWLELSTRLKCFSVSDQFLTKIGCLNFYVTFAWFLANESLLCVAHLVVPESEPKRN